MLEILAKLSNILGFRSSHLRNFAVLIGKHLYQSLFFNNVAGFGPAALLKKRLGTGVSL